MAQQREFVIADQRAVTPRLRWLTLHAPDLARSARAGQYLLVRCAEAGSYDPLLRRPLFIAAAESALGQIALLYEPTDHGLAWLSRGHAGDTLDVIGSLGHPFALDTRTRNLLLLGAGPGLAALLMLAREVAARGGAVTLLAGAEAAESLPPPFLLPGEIEYQTTIGPAVDLLRLTTDQQRATTDQRPAKSKRPQATSQSTALSPIAWADQVCAALPHDQLLQLRDAIQQVKYRWERGFASALLDRPIICGVGACGVCAIETRKGSRMLCADGPVFDLRDVGSRP